MRDRSESLRRAWPILAILSAASLSACASLEALEKNVASLLTPPEPVQTPAAIVLPELEFDPFEDVSPPATPKAKPQPAAAAPPRTARLTPAPERVQPQPLPLPDIKLVGVSRDQAETLLGSPTEQREAAPAKIWQYRSGECVVDLYFYLDVARNDFFALHYDVRNESAAVAGEAADRCLQRIYSEKHR